MTTHGHTHNVFVDRGKALIIAKLLIKKSTQYFLFYLFQLICKNIPPLLLFTTHPLAPPFLPLCSSSFAAGATVIMEEILKLYY